MMMMMRDDDDDDDWFLNTEIIVSAEKQWCHRHKMLRMYIPASGLAASVGDTS